MIDILQTLPTDTFVTAAFAELLEDVTNLLSAADGKDERAFWRKQQTALNKAQYHFLNGVRPTLTGDAYLMPSASSSGLNVYRLVRMGGILVCDCKAGEKGTLCWHHQLLCVVERAAELESLAAERDQDSQLENPDGGSEPTAGPNPIPHASAAAAWLSGQQQLAQRLSATAQYLEALRSAQGRTELPAMALDAPRRLGMRLVAARKRSAYFASAFYLEAA